LLANSASKGFFFESAAMSEKTPLDCYQVGHVVGPGGRDVNEEFGYRLLVPSEIVPGEVYPLMVFLHGRDQRGRDNAAQLKYLPAWMAEDARRRAFPCFLVAPQCREDAYWVETPRAFDRAAPRQSPRAQMQAVIDIVEEVVRDFPVDPARLYLTGLSMGGFGTWDLGTRLAERWAAVAPICGGGDELYADRLVGVPVWAWHGAADDVVPVARSRVMIEAIRAAGGEPRYTELEGVGHDCWTQAYTDPQGVVPWMFAQRKP
jgi:predicted peptidase